MAEPAARIFNLMRFALHDGPGIRTAVFFKGCPLRCWWCHNPESQQFQPGVLYFADRCRHRGDCITSCPEHAILELDGGLRISAACRCCGRCVDACQAEARQIAGRRIGLAELLREIEKDVIFFDESGGGVTLSGGEPLAQPRFVSALLAECRARGIHTTLETCGYAPRDTFLNIAAAADLVLFDLKLLDAARHRRYTGVSNAPILRNLEALARAPVVRIPVIPGINDGEEDIRQFTEYLSRVPVRRVDLLPYHASGAEKYKRLGLAYRLAGTPQPAARDLERFAEALARTGLTVNIGGQS